MKPDLVVKNAKVVNSLGMYEGHILIKQGKILAVVTELDHEPESVIDAKGLYVGIWLFLYRLANWRSREIFWANLIRLSRV